MKTVLKTNLFFVCLAFVICFGITAVSYGQAVVSVDPAESPSPGVGQQLTIRLQITNGQNVEAYEVSVNFDTSALRYVSGLDDNAIVDVSPLANLTQLTLLRSTPHFVQSRLKNAQLCAVPSLRFVENSVSIVVFRLAQNLLNLNNVSSI